MPARPIEKGITIREPVEQSRGSLTTHPTESVDRKGKGILIEESKKSKKDSCLTLSHETVQSTPTEQEKKKCDDIVESVGIANPEESTIQSTANPDSSTIPDGGTTTNPDGSIPDEQGNTNTDEQENVAAHDFEEENPELEDEQKTVSKLNEYVYLNEKLST